MAVVDEAKLRYLDFLSREDRVRHHRYVEEMKQYDMMRAGDINAIAESTRLWDSGLYGYLSDDPLKNAKYRFVTTITLATRFAIEGGMDEEDAYNASDLYIQNLENCKTPDDVRRLHTDMMTFFTWAMADMQKAEGPGRGSAAGSLVAYAMKITNIDPLRFGLIFERFLNPERVSPPDIDIDFCLMMLL